MSHLDTQAEFSDAQTVADGDTSTNVMKLSGDGLSPNDATNIGSPAITYLVVQLAAAGEGTIGASLVSSTSEDLSDPTTHLTFSKDASDLAAGDYLFVAPLPFDDYQDYLGLSYTGAGTVNAFLTLDPWLYRVYSDGLDDPATGRP